MLMELHRRLYPSIFRIAYKPNSFSFQTQRKAAKRDKAPKKMYEPCHRNIEDRELQTHLDMTH